MKNVGHERKKNCQTLTSMMISRYSVTKEGVIGFVDGIGHINCSILNQCGGVPHYFPAHLQNNLNNTNHVLLHNYQPPTQSLSPHHNLSQIIHAQYSNNKNNNTNKNQWHQQQKEQQPQDYRIIANNTRKKINKYQYCYFFNFLFCFFVMIYV